MRLTTLLTAFVFLTFCGAARAQTVLPETKTVLPVKALGSFMKVKSDGEHARGYSVDLWKQGDKIYGLISAHRGLIGDPPAGLLEDVRFDPQTKRFSFKAKLTLGLFSDQNNKEVPSRDVFEFSGTLTNSRLAGNLLITNELCTDKCIERKKINLPRSKEWSKMMTDYKSYAEWKTATDEIIKLRGPEW